MAQLLIVVSVAGPEAQVAAGFEIQMGARPDVEAGGGCEAEVVADYCWF